MTINIEYETDRSISSTFALAVLLSGDVSPLPCRNVVSTK